MADDASSVLSDKPSNLGDSSNEVCTFFLGNIVFCLLYSAGCKTKPLIYLFICCLNNLLCILQFINCIFQQLKASWYYFCFYYVVNIFKKSNLHSGITRKVKCTGPSEAGKEKRTDGKGKK